VSERLGHTHRHSRCTPTNTYRPSPCPDAGGSEPVGRGERARSPDARGDGRDRSCAPDDRPRYGVFGGARCVGERGQGDLPRRRLQRDR
jgi:hypothetical protein